MNYYEVLGLTKDCNSDEIRQAYKRKALQWHPDKNPGNPEAEANFKAVSEAYQLLSDESARHEYDHPPPARSESASPGYGAPGWAQHYNASFRPRGGFSKAEDIFEAFCSHVEEKCEASGQDPSYDDIIHFWRLRTMLRQQQDLEVRDNYLREQYKAECVKAQKRQARDDALEAKRRREMKPEDIYGTAEWHKKEAARRKQEDLKREKQLQADRQREREEKSRRHKQEKLEQMKEEQRAKQEALERDPVFLAAKQQKLQSAVEKKARWEARQRAKEGREQKQHEDPSEEPPVPAREPVKVSQGPNHQETRNFAGPADEEPFIEFDLEKLAEASSRREKRKKKKNVTENTKQSQKQPDSAGSAYSYQFLVVLGLACFVGLISFLGSSSAPEPEAYWTVSPPSIQSENEATTQPIDDRTIKDLVIRVQVPLASSFSEPMPMRLYDEQKQIDWHIYSHECKAYKNISAALRSRVLSSGCRITENGFTGQFYRADLVDGDLKIYKKALSYISLLQSASREFYDSCR